MTDRERLLRILNVPIYPHEHVDPLEAVADYLLDNGVRVPVLCKECKFYEPTWNDEYLQHGICHFLNDEHYDDGFCHHGEREYND